MQRYAVYYAPRPGTFADHAAAWLNGIALPTIAANQREGPRRYGFHGTLRAPFRPADSVTLDDIISGVAALVARMAPVECDGLWLENLDGFLALTPIGDTAALSDLASEVVRGTNALRAPLTAIDVARRRPEALTAQQRALMEAWGYPFVMEAFQFHLTLTDRLPSADAAATAIALQAYFADVLPRPFRVEDLCLFGEDTAGAFHLLHRYPLLG